MRLTTLTAGGMTVFLLALSAALAVFYSYVYRREGRQAHGLFRPRQWTLRALRIVVATMVILAIAAAGRFVHAPHETPAGGGDARRRFHQHELSGCPRESTRASEPA